MKERCTVRVSGQDGIRREGLILKGFLQYEMRHDFEENGTRISLKSLAIPAGLEPATRGVEIRYSIQLSYGTVRRPDRLESLHSTANMKNPLSGKAHPEPILQSPRQKPDGGLLLIRR